MRDEYEGEMEVYHSHGNKPEKQSDWLLDITKEPYRFVPLDGDAIIFEAAEYSPRCPGRLVYLYHAEGEKKIDDWKHGNPEWHEKYRRAVR